MMANAANCAAANLCKSSPNGDDFIPTATLTLLEVRHRPINSFPLRS